MGKWFRLPKSGQPWYSPTGDAPIFGAQEIDEPAAGDDLLSRSPSDIDAAVGTVDMNRVRELLAAEGAGRNRPWLIEKLEQRAETLETAHESEGE